MEETGQVTSMICFSPDFTHPDADERRRQVERQKAAIDLDRPTRRAGTAARSAASVIRACARDDGIARTVDGIRRSLEYAEQRDVVLCMENHYKDGTWRYPEFAQPEDIFLEIVERIDSPHFGVQYDPSNALVGGYDPIALPREGASTASSRCTPRIATWRRARRWTICATGDGAHGYAAALRHGETGQGHERLRRDLPHPGASVGFDGWISIEDGMNGLDEMARSVQFLKKKRAQVLSRREPSVTRGTPVIEVRGIRKAYGRTIAVDDVSFDVEQGEIFGLIGPNGAGKTTTMECVEGLRTTDRGTDQRARPRSAPACPRAAGPDRRAAPVGAAPEADQGVGGGGPVGVAVSEPGRTAIACSSSSGWPRSATPGS